MGEKIMKANKRSEIKYITNRILDLYPDAKISIIKTHGKHYMKIIVQIQNMKTKSTLSSSPRDRNWFKALTRQILNNINKFKYT